MIQGVQIYIIPYLCKLDATYRPYNFYYCIDKCE